MAGVDWAGMAARYRPLIDRLGRLRRLHRPAVGAERRARYSHAYAIRPAETDAALGPGAARRGPGRGRRGPVADRARAAGRVLGDRGTLAAAGDRACAPVRETRSGGGRAAVDPVRGPNPLLAARRAEPVELTLRRDGDGGPARVAVVPLGWRRPALPRQDRVAPGAGARELRRPPRLPARAGHDVPGWAEFHRGLHAELAREGLVLRPPREQRRAHLALVVEKLARRVIGWVAAAPGRVTPLPAPRAARPDRHPHGRVRRLGRRHRPQRLPHYGVGPLVGCAPGAAWSASTGRTAGGPHHVHPAEVRLLVRRPRVGASRTTAWTPTSRCRSRRRTGPPAATRNSKTAIRLALEALERTPAASPPPPPQLGPETFSTQNREHE